MSSVPEEEVLRKLRDEVERTRKACVSASARFDTALKEFASAKPHPERARLRRASEDLRQAANVYLQAVVRLNDYLQDGSLPEDPPANT